MEQRQLRLGDTLDDYCPRERRVTNHAVVALVGADVKQTRCTTCESEHEYKHAKVPRQRKKSDSPAALYAQVASSAPKRAVSPQGTKRAADEDASPEESVIQAATEERAPSAAEVRSFLDAESQPAPDDAPLDASALDPSPDEEDEEDSRGNRAEEGPVHRQLIRASLPREGQPAASRPIPEFTIRQPTGRPGRFRPRAPQHGGGGQQFQGHRANGNGPQGNHRGGGPRPQGGRPPQGQGNASSRQGRHNGPGRNRPK